MEKQAKDIFPDGDLTMQKLEDFFGTRLPDPITIENGLSIDLRDRMGIERLVHERAPFLCIDKAILIEGSCNRIISMASVTIEMCEGHFPGRPMIPLLVFSKIIALTGEILVSWTKKSDAVPLAIRADNVRAKSRKIVSPPTRVVTEAIYLREKTGISYLAAKSWVGNENVAVMDKLIFFSMPFEQFFSGQ
jgi:3-hydroxymyristoyl/3-hydroxydecanoyl-(acyl carrier protein) dehydratase